jgi:hypothetical protein
VQRAELEYLRYRAIESTPTRFKDSEDNRIDKFVLLPYKVSAMATKLWNREGPGGVRSRGFRRTFARHDITPSQFVRAPPPEPRKSR